MIAGKRNYYTSRKILVTYFAVLVLVPYILLSGLQIFLYVDSISTETVKAGREAVEQVNISVEKQVNKMKNFITMLVTSEEYKNFLANSHPDAYGYSLHEAYEGLKETIQNNTLEDFNIKSLVIVNQYDRVYTYGPSGYFDFEDVEETEWYRETMEANGKFCWFEKQTQGENEFTISLVASKKIYDIQTLEATGAVYVEIQNDFFDVNLKDDRDDSLLYLIDENKKPLLVLEQRDEVYNKEFIEKMTQMIMEPDFQENRICRLDGRAYIPVVSAPNATGWFVVKVIPVGQLTETVIRICLVSGVIMFSCFIIFFGMFLLVYRRIARPMQYLIGLLNEIKADPEVEIDLGKYPCYEAIRLGSEIVNLSRENETVHGELRKISAIRNEVELDKLQAEINPHYVYNTLTAIKYMALQNGQAEIGSMITALVKVLRSTVNRDGRYITVEQEAENLQQYIYIQRILNKNKIVFTVDVENEVKNYYMPNFILQPLVENAIIHGLNPKNCEGTIEVKIFGQNHRIIILVTDDGVGIDPHKLECAETVHTKGTGVTNIALPGIMKKIELLYGGRGYMQIEPAAAGGTVVTVSVPDTVENKRGRL